MEPVVVDTDVASYVFKEDSRAANYRPFLTGRLRVLSFMSLAELQLWAGIAGWGAAHQEEFAVFLRGFVVPPYEPDLCQAWASVTLSARQAGRPIQTADAWIAATALVHGVPLVTNNPADYAGVAGLRLLTA